MPIVDLSDACARRRVVAVGVRAAWAMGAASVLYLALASPFLAIAAAALCAAVAGERSGRLDLQGSREEMLRRLARVVEFRDSDTGGHVERMSAYAAVIATRLGFGAGDARQLQLAATMHDVGKVAVPDAVLQKPGPLTPGERTVMERHAEVGHAMLSGPGGPLLDLAATVACTHHERWDGAGYPAGLRGSAIPLAGRIVAVADVFDALTSDRVYKDAMPFDEAVDVIREGAGSQFDPVVVEAFVRGLDDVRAVASDSAAARVPRFTRARQPSLA